MKPFKLFVRSYQFLFAIVLVIVSSPLFLFIDYSKLSQFVIKYCNRILIFSMVPLVAFLIATGLYPTCKWFVYWSIAVVAVDCLGKFDEESVKH